MENLKQQIAYCSNWCLPVLVNDKGEVFYRPENTQIRLPFVTSDEFKLIEVSSNLKDLVFKILMLEKRNEVLQTKVDANYSSTYIEKYFTEMVTKYPDFNMIHHIINRHNKFLEDIVFGRNESKWKKRNDEIKEQKLEKIETDRLRIELFMEYLNTTK